MYYISITGLKVRSLWLYPLFIRYAVPAKIQADKAEGVIFVGVKRINGIEHTLTAWKSKKDMLRYLGSGAHAKAMKHFRKIATGKTFGYESETIPSWEEVHQLWIDKGREY